MGFAAFGFSLGNMKNYRIGYQFGKIAAILADR